MTKPPEQPAAPMPCPSCGTELVDARYLAQRAGITGAQLRLWRHRGLELPRSVGFLQGLTWRRDVVDAFVDEASQDGRLAPRKPGRRPRAK